MIIAGEVSGDMHAADLVRALRQQNSNLTIFGVGGNELRAAGMEIIVDARSMAVLGLSDVLLKYRFFRRVFQQMLDLARTRRPDLVLLIDYPGFNLRFAARARRLGLKVVYYICPQVWAWNRRRAPRMARHLNRLITIFPFEAEAFRGTGLAVDFVGHPLLTATKAALAAELQQLAWQGQPQIAILPGSRYDEIRRILPTMWAAARLLEERFHSASFIIAAPTPKLAEWIQATIAKLPAGPTRWAIAIGQTRQVLRQARAALITSGTATLEAALMGCPMLVVYKTSWLTYILGRLLIRVPHLGMVNIVAGTTLCPEFIQGRARPRALADALARLLAEGLLRNNQLQGLQQVTAALGPDGAAARAAAVVLEELA